LFFVILNFCTISMIVLGAKSCVRSISLVVPSMLCTPISSKSMVVLRKEHFLSGAEYVMYADLIKKHGCLDLRYSGTQRFVSSEQLVNLGLIREMAWTRMNA
jgi:hypothetical protein